MKKGILVFVFSALAFTAATTASARVDVSIGIAPFGFGYYAPPPVVYQPEPYYQPYYEPAPTVYIGGGYWGGRDYGDDRRDRGRGNRGNRGRGHGSGEHH